MAQFSPLAEFSPEGLGKKVVENADDLLLFFDWRKLSFLNFFSIFVYCYLHFRKRFSSINIATPL